MILECSGVHQLLLHQISSACGWESVWDYLECHTCCHMIHRRSWLVFAGRWLNYAETQARKCWKNRGEGNLGGDWGLGVCACPSHGHHSSSVVQDRPKKKEKKKNIAHQVGSVLFAHARRIQHRYFTIVGLRLRHSHFFFIFFFFLLFLWRWSRKIKTKWEIWGKRMEATSCCYLVVRDFVFIWKVGVFV